MSKKPKWKTTIDRQLQPAPKELWVTDKGAKLYTLKERDEYAKAIADESFEIAFLQRGNLDHAVMNLQSHLILIQVVVLNPYKEHIKVCLLPADKKALSVRMASDHQEFIKTYKRIMRIKALYGDIRDLSNNYAILVDLIGDLENALTSNGNWQKAVKAVQHELGTWGIAFFDTVSTAIEHINRGGSQQDETINEICEWAKPMYLAGESIVKIWVAVRTHFEGNGDYAAKKQIEQWSKDANGEANLGRNLNRRYKR